MMDQGDTGRPTVTQVVDDCRDKATKRRFVEHSEEDLVKLIDSKDAENTKKVIGNAVNILSQYIAESNHSSGEQLTLEAVQNMPPSELAGLLRKMWPSLRRQDGEKYSKKSLQSVRYGLQRHFLKIRKLDIVTDPDFKDCNEMFSSTTVQLKREGKAAINHKFVIQKEDMKKLNAYLNLETPQGLQGKVFVDFMLHFCNRGRENLRDLQKSAFAAGVDAHGLKYISMVTDMATKNHRDDDEQSCGGILYEVKDSPSCPYQAFSKYLAKLHPEYPWFWQRPKAKYSQHGPWYDNMPLGKNTLGTMMKTLSQKAELSKIYTNHCLRATCVTTLDQEGFEARHIMAVSGHKSESSIRQYSRHVSEAKKRSMSNALATATIGSKHEQNNQATSNVEVLETVNLDEILMDIANIEKQQNVGDSSSSREIAASGEMEGQQMQMSGVQASGSTSSNGGRQPVFNFKDCNININFQ